MTGPHPYSTRQELHNSVDWNIFRLAADYLHFAGLVFGLATVCWRRSVAGFSCKTQVLYQLVYVTRYFDMFEGEKGTYLYLIFFKMSFILITLGMLFAFLQFRHSYDSSRDSCNVLSLVMPAAALACGYSSSGGNGHHSKGVCWLLSEFLEPVALLPQYILCYRSAQVRPATVLYVLAVGGYRTLYVCSWIYKRYVWRGSYHDYISWFSGVVEGILFVDFVMRISQHREVNSFLGRSVLRLDSSSGAFSEMIEMRTMGRRMPFGLTGHGPDSLLKETPSDCDSPGHSLEHLPIRRFTPISYTAER